MLGRLFVPFVGLVAALALGRLMAPDAPKAAPEVLIRNDEQVQVDRNAAAIDAALTRVVERLHERVTALERKP